MAETAQYLTLGLAGETFGISIRNVREILDMRPISKLPHAPAFLLGMIDVRGSGYPIVDLRTKLDLPQVAATEATRIIILDVPLQDRLVGVGFVADCVFEVTDIDESRIEPAPSVGGRWKSDYLAGIGRKGDKFVMVFDLARLMATQDVQDGSADVADSPSIQLQMEDVSTSADTINDPLPA
ncbi:chemotaxis protein CheW [Bradyrhizobium sp. SYSU BS000235]|uniref:chemotaxis protein CheW n=1 Tax=Bradyrhizobium sp. SYSU BS000235 TaxID=3411332 RepID=UPI003C7443BF